MIDPINSLVFSMHANKGVYALLLGSGLSRAARIPTGWEITIELIRKVAVLEGESCDPDPVAWFRGKTGREPNYSDLLNTIAKTPAERQQLLRSYWEPTESEREEGAKVPTTAHRAIADIVKLGYVKVILTTNFDRLLEAALQDVGIQPTVLSSPDHIDGALPLIHTPCTVIKIHGDYLDTRIRNTPAELAKYPKAFNLMLDRIFDEFGLVVVGWSADWDEALRRALIRAPYRRFSVYWASRGEPSVHAIDLISRRGATVIPITDADSFFSTVSEQLKALEEFSRPHPLSTEAAVATLKRYLAEPKYRIALDDLVTREVEGVTNTTNRGTAGVNMEDFTGENILARLKLYEAASQTIMRMAFIAGQWSDGSQLTSWLSALVALSNRRATSGVVTLVELQRYPATLLLYCFGLGAVKSERWDSLNTLFCTSIPREYSDDKRAVEVLSIWGLFQTGAEVMKILPGREQERTPLQNHLEALLWPLFRADFPSEAAFHLIFDRLEIFAALSFAVPAVESQDNYWALPGSFAWRRENRIRILSDIRKSLATLGNGSPFVKSSLIGKSFQHGIANIEGLEKLVSSLHWH